MMISTKQINWNGRNRDRIENNCRLWTKKKLLFPREKPISAREKREEKSRSGKSNCGHSIRLHSKKGRKNNNNNQKYSFRLVTFAQKYALNKKKNAKYLHSNRIIMRVNLQNESLLMSNNPLYLFFHQFISFENLLAIYISVVVSIQNHNGIQRPQKVLLFSFKFYLFLLLFEVSHRIQNKPF